MGYSINFNFDDNRFAEIERRIVDGLDASKPGPFAEGMKRAAARYLGFIRRRYVGAARGDGTWRPLSPATIAARLRKSSGSLQRVRKAKADLARSRFLSDELSARDAMGRALAARKIERLKRQLGSARSLSDEQIIRRKIADAERSRGRTAATASRKAADAKGTPAGPVEILRDTGILFNSLSQGAPGHFERLQPTIITVGSIIQYAKYHQLGDGVPQRLILVEPDPQTAVNMKLEIEGGAKRALEAAIRG